MPCYKNSTFTEYEFDFSLCSTGWSGGNVGPSHTLKQVNLYAVSTSYRFSYIKLCVDLSGHLL